MDNRVYRQFAGCDTLKASAKLSMMRDLGLLEMKGKGKATYYVAGDSFLPATLEGSMSPNGAAIPLNGAAMPDKGLPMSNNGSAMCNSGITMSNNDSTMSNSGIDMCNNELIQKALRPLRKRLKSDVLDQIVVDLCEIAEFERSEIARFIKRDESYVRKILARLLRAGRVKMRYPEMPKHPHQKYRAKK